jgi:DNA-binding transcriptional MerR regulator/methylmalonyl-CoA mutase cobalamin-binding subunit
MNDNPLYSIRYVSKQTGLPAHLIRTWESRYQAVKPKRTETNRRLYRDADISRLRALGDLVNAGHSISQVAGLPHEQLNKMRDKYTHRLSHSRLSANGQYDASHFFDRALKCIVRMDTTKLETELNKAAISLSKPKLLFDVIVVLQDQMKKLYDIGQLRQVNINVANTVVRAFLWDLLRTVAIADTAPKLVVATPRGQSSEIGALIIAIVAAESGWRSKYLGLNLHPADIAAAAVHFNARAAVLRATEACGGSFYEADIASLEEILSSDIKLIICSDVPHRHQPVRSGNHIIVPHLELFRETLEALPTGDIN